MTVVSGWILSIAGVIILSILVDLILPNGSTATFIKNIFGYIIIIVIIAPLVSILTNKDFNLENYFNGNEVIIQEGFVSTVNQQYLNELEGQIEDELIGENILGVEVGVSANIFIKTLQIKQVSIDLSNLVIDENISHINIKTSIKNVVLKFVDIEEV